MSLRDPAFIISSLTPTRDGRSISSHNTDLIIRIHLLSPRSGFARAGSVFAATFVLGEEGRDPGVVDEIDCSREEAEEEEVEEDAVDCGRDK